jgi:adenylosuccinate lyase
MALVTAGANRQAMHEIIREHAMEAWQARHAGGSDVSLRERLGRDARVLAYVPAEALARLFDAHAHIGDAPERARAMAEAIRDTLDAETTA